jgi:aspartate/methionine/tyrosine aminotransferase
VKSYAADRLQNLQESVIRSITRYDEVGVATVPGSSFYASDTALGRGLVRFAFPKKDETLDLVEERFEKL